MKCISLFLLCIIAAYTFSAVATIEITAPMQLADYKMNAEIYKTINEQLHENPHSVIKENILCFEEMERYNTINAFQAALLAMREQNPLWMLGECSEQHCALTRSACHDPRKSFEDIISAHACATFAKKKEAVNYLSFASGYGFTDFMAILKPLDNGVTQLNFHVIELQNHCYIATIEQFKKSQIEAFEALPQLHDLLTNHVIDEDLKASLNEDAIAEYLAIAKRHELYSQMMHWIQVHYPKVKFRILLHRDVNEYKKHIESHPADIPDVVGAIDFGKHDKRCIAFQAEAQFNDLTIFVKQHNKSVFVYFDIDGTNNQQFKKELKPSRECDSCFTVAAIGALSMAALFIINKIMPKLVV